MVNVPNTPGVAAAIVGYLSNLQYPDTSQVYQAVQLEQIKDVINLVSNGGACAEVYGDIDSSEHATFGGGIWDVQQWYILSMCSIDTPTLAQKIYAIRDALVVPYQSHFRLGDSVTGIIDAQFLPNSGKHSRIMRNGQYVRAYQIHLVTRLNWQLAGGATP